MKIVNMHEAKTHLSKLIAEAERGEDIVIARDGEPVAHLTRFEKINRTPGLLRQHPDWANWKYDPSVFAPLITDAELAEEGWPV